MENQCKSDQTEPDMGALMLAEYGPLLTGQDLVAALGYPTPAAFWQARRCGRVQVRTFRIPGRRGTFALTTDVAGWLLDAANNVGAKP